MMKEKNTYSFKKLLSIHLQSNNPKNFEEFIISMEENIQEHDLIEIIVKIDDDDVFYVVFCHVSDDDKTRIKGW